MTTDTMDAQWFTMADLVRHLKENENFTTAGATRAAEVFLKSMKFAGLLIEQFPNNDGVIYRLKRGTDGTERSS
jgi:hypothetical protein